MQTRSQTKLAQSKLSIITKENPSKVSCLSSSPSSSPVTRSQTKQSSQVAPVFDFDEASAAWLLNKNKLGNGTYSYKAMPVSSRSGITTRSGRVLYA